MVLFCDKGLWGQTVAILAWRTGEDNTFALGIEGRGGMLVLCSNYRHSV